MKQFQKNDEKNNRSIPEPLGIQIEFLKNEKSPLVA